MNELLARFFEDLERSVKAQFDENIVKVSELKSSFFVLIKKDINKILDFKRIRMLEKLKRITEDLYENYAKISFSFYRGYFPYFKLVKSYGGYHFHFSVIKKDYGC